MSTEAAFEPRIVSHVDDYWDIVSAWYKSGSLYIKFKDGTEGSISTAQFPALSNATELDFDDLQVSPCGLILENDRIEWDYAEAGLYKLIKSEHAEP